MRCPSCKNKVIQKTGDVTRIRAGGPIEFMANGECHTKCHWCKGDIQIRVQLKEDVVIPTERFVIPEKK